MHVLRALRTFCAALQVIFVRCHRVYWGLTRPSPATHNSPPTRHARCARRDRPARRRAVGCKQRPGSAHVTPPRLTTRTTGQRGWTTDGTRHRVQAGQEQEHEQEYEQEHEQEHEQERCRSSVVEVVVGEVGPVTIIARTVGVEVGLGHRYCGQRGRTTTGRLQGKQRSGECTGA